MAKKPINTEPLKDANVVSNIVRHKYNPRGGSGDIQLETITIKKNGTYYPNPGTAWKQVVVQVEEYVNPIVTVSLTPNKTLMDKEVDTISELLVSTNVKLGTSEIQRIKVEINGTVVKEFADGVKDGGIFLHTQTYSPATNANITVKVTAYDVEGEFTEVTKKISFVYKTYYGTVSNLLVNPTEDDIKALSNKIIGSKSFVYEGITMEFGKILYAYPVDYGALNSIRDTKNNINYTESFTKIPLQINGINYLCYLQTDASAAEGVQLTFN
ncbi:MAG: hypothetical protein MJZ37_00015 [Bacilli bacterium]|nr:hypothetical protein [Bacilli bacterium]